MGSYNVSCSVSGLTINYSEKAYLIFLQPRHCQILELKQKNFYDHSHVDSPHLYAAANFIYSDRLYKPFGLPILGSYNDYGRLESIEANAWTEDLENRFGVGIEDIAAVVCTCAQYDLRRRQECWKEAKALPGKTKDGFDILAKLSGMFVHKEIYDYMASYVDKESFWYEYRAKGASMEDLYDRCQKSIIEFDIQDAKNRESEDYSYLMADHEDPILGDRHSPEELHFGNLLSHNWYGFKRFFRNHIKEGRLKKELCDFIRFDSSLSTANRLYFPGMYAGQDSVTQFQKEFHLAALRAIGNRINYINTEYCEEQETSCKICGEITFKYFDDACRDCHVTQYGW